MKGREWAAVKGYFTMSAKALPLPLPLPRPACHIGYNNGIDILNISQYLMLIIFQI